MKKSLVLVAVALTATFALAQKAPSKPHPKFPVMAPISVEDFAKKAKEFDGKLVNVIGVVKSYQAKTSKGGSKYTIFDLTAGKGSVKIYVHGSLAPDPKNGDRVQVVGTYAVERKVGANTFKNEIDATPKAGDKLSEVKILPGTTCKITVSENPHGAKK